MLNTSKKTGGNNQSDSFNKLKLLGEVMISDKKFDIKRYLDTAENHFKYRIRKKKNLKPIFNLSTDYLNYKYSKPNAQIINSYINSKNKNNNTNISIKSNTKFCNCSFNQKKKKNIILTNVDTKKLNLNKDPLRYNKTNDTLTNNNNNNKNIMDYLYSYEHSKSIYNKKMLNRRYKNMFNTSKKNEKRTRNTEENNNGNVDCDVNYDDDDEEDKKLFKIEKVVKEIRKNKNKSFDFNKYKETMKNYYEKKNASIALDSDLVLYNYKTKHRRLKERDIPLETFITENKEISINNLIIKLMHKESDKLIKKEKILIKDLKSNRLDLESGEKKFEEYTDIQKIECKKIEKTLTELQKINRNLMEEEKKFKLGVKIKEYEIYKILVNMNVYRFYAKFANQILDGDATRFQNPIISTEAEFDKINFEPIIKEVLDNYWSMKKYDPKKDKNDSNKAIKYYKEEGYFLYDPELVYHKYNEMEGNILRLLKSKEKLLLKIKTRKEQNDEALSYLIVRCNILQQEYNELYKKYKEENSKYINCIKNSGSTHIDVNILEKNNLIKELYMSVINEFEPTLQKISKMNNREFKKVDRKDLSLFDEIIKYGQYVLENIEMNLNCFLLKMKSDEEKNKKIFDKVIYGIKTDYKLLRQSLFFENKIKKEVEQRKKIVEKNKRINMSHKKSEPPYYTQRIYHKEEIDVESVKKEEDKELMRY